MYTGFSRVIYSTPHGSVILVSLETRLVSYETRLVSLETRLVSRETRGGKLRVSGTVLFIVACKIDNFFYLSHNGVTLRC